MGTPVRLSGKQKGIDMFSWRRCCKYCGLPESDTRGTYVCGTRRYDDYSEKTESCETINRMRQCNEVLKRLLVEAQNLPTINGVIAEEQSKWDVMQAEIARLKAKDGRPPEVSTQ